MLNQKFNPNEYKNKKTIYVSVSGVPGVSAIWDWSDRRKKYCKRALGNKFYSVKRIKGRQKTKCFSRLADAKLWQQSQIDEAAQEDTDLYFSELLEKFFKKKRNEVRVATLESYESKSKHLKFFKNMLVSNISPKVIDSWLEHMKTPQYLKTQHKSRTSYRHELDLLRTVLDFYGEYICEDNSYNLPFKKRHRKDCIVDRIKYEQAKNKNKQKHIPRETIVSFLSELKANVLKQPENEVYAALGLFQFTTGTRISEACAVDWKNLDLENKFVVIKRGVCWSRKKGRATFVQELTKNGDFRTIYLPEELVAELKEWKLKTGRSKGLVFSKDGFEPLKRRAVQYRYDRALKKAGSEWKGTHLLRHSFATDFLEQTQNQKALQGILGHRTAQQTNHYATITNRLMQNGMDQYHDSYSEIAKVINIGGVRKVLGS